ncbi:hypothetical protein [Rhizobium grahamii]|uniref:DUF4376 domain-containing protein n=1 Tax=Rhizobium grahamii CCGE 502 TaxID=990285 RepID=S3I2Y9_9HYPH|nr:hypothetical protein [Rhizobium grahamii]EPE99546.1 hypothetical protein RGCCGE502_05165 [Rhizobium grahamii CCGE 502]
MEVIGFQNPENTVIRAIIDGAEMFVPDQMGNKERRRIWDEWEMAPAPEGTPDDQRERANSIPLFPEPALPAIKAALKASIDAAAETERLKYITGGTGQAMTYQQKSDEARRYITAIGSSETPINPADYPLLSAEVGITAPTLGEVVAVVNAAFLQWQMIGGAIEAIRLGTKAAIDASGTVAEAEAAAGAAVWP